jgi:hypothetical protein
MPDWEGTFITHLKVTRLSAAQRLLVCGRFLADYDRSWIWPQLPAKWSEGPRKHSPGFSLVRFPSRGERPIGALEGSGNQCLSNQDVLYIYKKPGILFVFLWPLQG